MGRYLPGEKFAIELVLLVGKEYGYGNVIAEVKRAWALALMQTNPRLTYQQALEFTNVDAYPETGFPPDEGGKAT